MSSETNPDEIHSRKTPIYPIQSDIQVQNSQAHPVHKRVNPIHHLAGEPPMPMDCAAMTRCTHIPTPRASSAWRAPPRSTAACLLGWGALACPRRCYQSSACPGQGSGRQMPLRHHQVEGHGDPLNAAPIRDERNDKAATSIDALLRGFEQVTSGSSGGVRCADRCFFEHTISISSSTYEQGTSTSSKQCWRSKQSTQRC